MNVKHNVMLTIASLLSIVLMTIHLSNDIVRGFEPGGFKNVGGVLTLVAWLYGTLVLAERRSGYIIILLGSLLGSVVPLAHMRGAGLVGGRIVNQRSLVLGLDADRARRDRALLRHPLGARTVEPAIGPVPVVQHPVQRRGPRRLAVADLVRNWLLSGNAARCGPSG